MPGILPQILWEPPQLLGVTGALRWLWQHLGVSVRQSRVCRWGCHQTHPKGAMVGEPEPWVQ